MSAKVNWAILILFPDLSEFHIRLCAFLKLKTAFLGFHLKQQNLLV